MYTKRIKDTIIGFYDGALYKIFNNQLVINRCHRLKVPRIDLNLKRS